MFYAFTYALLLAAADPVTPPSIRPAPDPWPLPADACRLVEIEARQIAKRVPKAKERIREVEQHVDCAGRTVTRIFATDSRSLRLPESARASAEKLACLTPAHQIMRERDGWTFRAEFRRPKQPPVTATAAAKCPPLTMRGYQSPQ